MFLLAKLPVAFFAGLKVLELSEEVASITVQEKWFNKNPFHSIYFAILAMAAEVSTGILCMSALLRRKKRVSMLVIKNESFFYKKAKGQIIFTCKDGRIIEAAIEETIQTGNGATVTCSSQGTNKAGELIAEFYFTWSFKAKKE